MDAIWTPTIPVRQLIGTILSVTFVFVTACAGDVKTDRQLARERANGYVAAYADLDANVAAATEFGRWGGDGGRLGADKKVRATPNSVSFTGIHVRALSGTGGEPSVRHAVSSRRRSRHPLY